jgi:hypothetical protein
MGLEKESEEFKLFSNKIEKDRKIIQELCEQRLKAFFTEEINNINKWELTSIEIKECRPIWIIQITLDNHIIFVFEIDTNFGQYRILSVNSPNYKQQETVNSPYHYSQGEIECIDAIKAALSKEEFKGFLKGNILKYLWREDKKGGVIDLQKAQYYLNYLVDLLS